MPSALPALTAIFLVAAAVGMARGEAVSLLGAASVFAPTRAMVEIPARAEGARSGASLFVGRAGGGLFSPVIRRSEVSRPPQVPVGPTLDGDRISRLRQLIGHAESRRHGYDAVQYGARVKPAKPPTAMTIGEIYAWIDATPGQPHAIGRFQFIPATLRRLVRQTGLSDRVRFTAAVQDRLADVLLLEAGLRQASLGEIGRHSFMKNLAKIWAGLPTSNGRSYYHGYAGNKASMSWADYDAAMAQLFPG